MDIVPEHQCTHNAVLLVVLLGQCAPAEMAKAAPADRSQARGPAAAWQSPLAACLLGCFVQLPLTPSSMILSA
jgi:hypothetical protein